MPRKSLLLLLVSIAAALPFFPALGGPFLWDDTHLIRDNPHVHALSHIGYILNHSLFDTGSATTANFIPYFRPLVHLTYAIDWAIADGNPAVFHATNLVLAMIAAALVATSLSRWSGAVGWPLVATLLFAWHPTKAESVAWISGRTDLLVTIFMLLVCEARAQRTKHPSLARVFEAIATLFAYASKETAVALPVFVLVEDWSARRQGVSPHAVVGVTLKSCSGHLAFALLYLLARNRWLPIVTWTHLASNHPSVLSRAGLVFETLGRALLLVALPYRQCAEHGPLAFNNHGQPVISWSYSVIGVLLVTGACGLSSMLRRRAPIVGAGLALLLFAQLPTANILPTQLGCVFYERFLYLPSIGAALLLVGLLCHFATTRRTRVRSLAVSSVVLTIFGIRSVARARDYSDAERFWRHERTCNSLSIVAEQNLAQVAVAHGNVAGAMQAFSRCHQNAEARRQPATAVGCAYDAAALAADFTPDLDRRTLIKLEQVFRVFAQAEPMGNAELDAFGLWLSINLDNRQANKSICQRRGESFAHLASIELRLQEPTAVADAHHAIELCPSCNYVLRAASVLAATNQVDAALSVIDRLGEAGPLESVDRAREQIEQFDKWRELSHRLIGPQQIHAEAQAHLSLGLYGMAYRVLLPHAGDFTNLPDLQLEFAQIATFAGDVGLAHETLSKLMPPSSATEQINTWLRPQTRSVTF